jgi:hypothetical protein
VGDPLARPAAGLVTRPKRDPREAALEADEAARYGGSLRARTAIKAPRGPAVYLLTSAQNNTHVHAAFWRNLQAYRRHLGATLYVSQFTYNKSSYPARDIKPDTADGSDHEQLWYANEIANHVFNERLQITPSLVFCGEVNILPTAVRPLSGFENYTGRASGIFSHAKQHMQSVPNLDAAKFNWTTGSCTLRNYLQKKAGLKAEYQHAYGALIVEVDADGDWFVRQLRATEDGAFHDLAGDGALLVRNGRITRGLRVEAVQPGDVHVEQMDPVVRQVHWGRGGMIDVLRPRYQFLHDTLDFKSRNHHEAKDPHETFRKYARGQDNVEAELRRVAKFLKEEAARADCQLVVVDSNHDQALTRWLREADLQADPVNALMYLKLQQRMYEAIAAGRENFHLFEAVMRSMGVPRSVRFLRTDESFVICRSAGGIECGMHGHAGANGGRGSPAVFARIGRRANTGHTHSAGIADDLFVAGTCSLLRLSYNRGLSSWSHSDIVTYPSGCRSIVTLWKGKWRGRKGSKARRKTGT